MLKIKDITIEKLKSGKLIKELLEFYALKKVIENNSWHNNESTFTHTLNVLKDLRKFLRNNKNLKLKTYLNKKIDNYTKRELLFLATVLHDIGKKETIIKNGEISAFPKHEEVSVVKTKKILKNFDLSKKEKDIILGVIKKHTYLHSIMEKDNKKLKTQFQRLKNSSKDYFPELVVMAMADTTSSFLKKTDLQKYNFRVDYYKNTLKTFF